jgi:hypothetical protein
MGVDICVSFTQQSVLILVLAQAHTVQIAAAIELCVVC